MNPEDPTPQQKKAMRDLAAIAWIKQRPECEDYIQEKFNELIQSALNETLERNLTPDTRHVRFCVYQGLVDTLGGNFLEKELRENKAFLTFSQE